MATTQDQYDKVHQYLLSQGQQELAGHLDAIWQELNGMRVAYKPENARTTAQDFQDKASNGTLSTSTTAPAVAKEKPKQ